MNNDGDILAVACLDDAIRHFLIVQAMRPGDTAYRLSITNWSEEEAERVAESTGILLDPGRELWLSTEDETHACYGTARIAVAGRTFVMHATHPHPGRPWVWLCPIEEFAVPRMQADGAMVAPFVLLTI